jgi:DNA-binding response OmpR family regulator
MKILLAEDDINISTVLTIALNSIGGHEVHTVSDGESALKLALADNFDLLLLDGMMPKRNGIQVAQKYHQQSGKFTPIIFLSAKSQRSDISEFLAVGMGYIQKPFVPTQICQLIDAILKGEYRVATSS